MKTHFFISYAIIGLFCFPVYSTHLTGGEITYKVTDIKTRTFVIKLVLYRDTGSGAVDQPSATLNFGDGSPCITQPISQRDPIGTDLEKITFLFNHSFPGDGTYIVSFYEENRRNDIVNFYTEGESTMSFYIDAQISVNIFTNHNSSFEYLENLVLKTGLGSNFSHTVIGSDNEGDSLSFRMTIPKAFSSASNLCGNRNVSTMPVYYVL